MSFLAHIYTYLKIEIKKIQDFPGGSVFKNPPANAGDTGSALVQEDPTCRGATEPMRHNYWACALKPASHNYWARVPQLLNLRATTTEPTCHNY